MNGGIISNQMFQQLHQLEINLEMLIQKMGQGKDLQYSHKVELYCLDKSKLLISCSFQTQINPLPKNSHSNARTILSSSS